MHLRLLCLFAAIIKCQGKPSKIRRHGCGPVASRRTEPEPRRWISGALFPAISYHGNFLLFCYFGNFFLFCYFWRCHNFVHKCSTINIQSFRLPKNISIEILLMLTRNYILIQFLERGNLSCLAPLMEREFLNEKEVVIFFSGLTIFNLGFQFFLFLFKEHWFRAATALNINFFHLFKFIGWGHVSFFWDGGVA